MPFLQFEIILPGAAVRFYSWQNVLSHPSWSVVPIFGTSQVSAYLDWNEPSAEIVTNPSSLAGRQLLIIGHGTQMAPISHIDRLNSDKVNIYSRFSEISHAPTSQVPQIINLNWFAFANNPPPEIVFVGTADSEMSANSGTESLYITKPLPGADTYNAPLRTYVPNHILSEDYVRVFDKYFATKKSADAWLDWVGNNEILGATTELLVCTLERISQGTFYPPDDRSGNPNPMYHETDVLTDVVFIKQGTIDLYNLLKNLRSKNFIYTRYVVSCCRAYTRPATISVFNANEVYRRQRIDRTFMDQLRIRFIGAGQMARHAKVRLEQIVSVIGTITDANQHTNLLREMKILTTDIPKMEENFNLAFAEFMLYKNPAYILSKTNLEIEKLRAENPQLNILIEADEFDEKKQKGAAFTDAQIAQFTQPTSHIFKPEDLFILKKYYDLKDRKKHAELCVSVIQQGMK